MESMTEEILREILFKLPTRDIVRGRSMSRQWHGILTDPSFLDIHANNAHIFHDTGGAAESLAIWEIHGGGIGFEMTILNSDSPKPMSRVSSSNVCNGFLLLASGVKDWHVFVCNPITGMMLKVLAPHGPGDDYENMYHSTDNITYAMAFSPSTRQYKLFRLCSRDATAIPDTCANYLDVCTLGDPNSRGWRRHPCMFRNGIVFGLHSPPPALVDGKLYVVTQRPQHYRVPDRMLVIDVASKTHETYRLPVDSILWDAVVVYPFDLRGQLCVAVRVAGRRQLSFWVLSPHHSEGDRLHGWEVPYTFHVNDDGRDKPSGAWFDAYDGMLCYMLGNQIYMYDTTRDKQQKAAGCFSEWDQWMQFPVAPRHQQWSVYDGYRPSLLSPRLAFAMQSSLQRSAEQQHFEHELIKCSAMPPTIIEEA